MLHPVALLLHLLCLVLLAAGGVGGMILHVWLERALRERSFHAATLGRLGAAFGQLAGMAALGMLASGLMLLASRGWADWGQPWLVAKLAVFALLFANSLAVARPSGASLGAGLAAAVRGQGTLDGAAVTVPMARMAVFHRVQTAGLVVLIVLGVFGPR